MAVVDRDRLETILQQTVVSIDGVSPQSLSRFHIPRSQIHVYEQVASTNQTLWALMDQGAPEGTVAIAQQQQAGRGQRGRSWQSSPGGLYLSLGLTPHRAAVTATGLTLSCAWGIAAALQTRQIPVGLKWVNDLVLEGQKLGGILTETRIHHGQIHRAVVGIGLNWQNPVPEFGIGLHPWLQQHPLPEPSSLEQLAAIALQGALTGYHLWQHHGMAALIPHYDSLLVNRGQTITLDGHPATILGITPQGQLRVHPTHAAPTVEHTLAPGEIQLGYPTPR